VIIIHIASSHARFVVPSLGKAVLGQLFPQKPNGIVLEGYSAEFFYLVIGTLREA
jgi:hypothetical protein